jgi:soluble lytic murein transglycosylase-like protein
MTPYRDLIEEVAGQCRLPLDLLTAQVLVESSGDPNAFRYERDFYDRYLRHATGTPRWLPYGPLAACSYGLLQILLVVAYEDGFEGRPEDLFDPYTGLLWGARHMQTLVEWAGPTNYVQALCAYNGGKGGNERPPYRSQVYADRVFARLQPPQQV